MPIPRDQPGIRRTLTPAAVSILVHGLLAAAVVGVTFSRPSRPDAPAAEFVLRAPAPNKTPEPTPLAPDPLPEHELERPTESPNPPLAGEVAPVRPPPTPPAPEPKPARVPATPAPLPTPAPAPVTFAGTRASATRIVYVVDLSGSMVSSLGLVINELERSIAELDGSLQFQVIFFHDLGDGTGVEPLADGWTRRADADLRAVSSWMNDRRPGGRSNPMDGLRAAIDLDPDAVFLLSRSIRRTGGGAWDRQAVLRELDARNPLRDGARRIAITTIQFIDDDPTGIMRDIGEAHGGYRVLTLDELMTK